MAEVLIDQREEDDAGRRLDLGDGAVELRPGPDQRVDVLDRRHVLVLGRDGTAGRDQRLAGRIRDQVQVEIVASHAGVPSVPWHRTGLARFVDPDRDERRARRGRPKPIGCLANPPSPTVIPAFGASLWTDGASRLGAGGACGQGRIRPTGQGRWGGRDRPPVDRGDCGDEERGNPVAPPPNPLPPPGIRRSSRGGFRSA